MANRKLQTEIDRTLKKVQEGIEIFDQLYNKVYNAPTPQQREKYEADLKKEIKKLQRYRDQIKTWASSSEVKDKSPLLEARRVIEQDMERFKVCEKETKTKAFSKEGLAQAAKKDPAAEAREKASEWLENCIEQIEHQKETVEAELEGLGGAKKGKKSANSDKMDELREVQERHNFHTTNLEQLLRLLENESITPEDVDEIKDGVEYYIESNMEDPDFYDDDTIYDDIKALSEVKENPDSSIAVDGFREKDDDDEEDEKETSKAKAAAAKAEAEAAKREESSKSAKPEPKPTDSVPQPAPSGSRNQPQLPIPLPTPLPAAQQNQQAAARAQQQQRAQAQAQAQAQALAQAQAAASQRQAAAGMVRNFQQQQQLEKQPQAPTPQVTSAQVVAPQKVAAKPAQEKAPAGDVRRGSAELAAPVEDPLAEDNLAVGGSDRADEHPVQMLEASFRNIPDPSDSERPKTYVPRNAYPTHTSFPDKPLPLFESPGMFEKLDIDTLFFIFYYQQGTYQQYLAARELKKQSWRFHKKYMTWFQRHEEPKVTTDEYEQGTYVYFDFETGWCQRIKSEFTFEYSYLEDELQV